MEMQREDELIRHGVNNVSIGNIDLQLDVNPLCGSGGRIWSSSIVLAGFISSNEHYRASMRSGVSVLELGAGVGLPGLVCALLGASVTLADYDLEVLQQLRSNVQRLAFDLEYEPRVVEVNWTRKDNQLLRNAHFEIIIGADITFSVEMFDHLLRIIREASTRDSTILLSERKRLRSLFEPDFFEDCAPEYFEVVELPVPVIPHYLKAEGEPMLCAELDEADRYVRIWKLSLR
jgi:predicted nicotinamide N-methyase